MDSDESELLDELWLGNDFLPVEKHRVFIFMCTQEQISTWASPVVSQEEYLFEYLATFLLLGFDAKVIKPVQVFLCSMERSNTFGFSYPPILFKAVCILCLSSDTSCFLHKVHHSEINWRCEGFCFQYIRCYSLTSKFQLISSSFVDGEKEEVSWELPWFLKPKTHKGLFSLQ